jgi:hypothetical protein
VLFDVDNETFSIDKERNGAVASQHFRNLGLGPNGGTLYEVRVRVQFDSGGNARKARVSGGVTNGAYSIFHHAQIENAAAPSSPIIMGSSQVNRGRDAVDVDLSDGWNERGLTLFFEVQLRYFNFTFVRIFKEPTVGGILVDNSSDGYRVGGNGITDQDLASNANGPFEVDRIALSLTPYETRFAVNGSGGIISEKWDILDSGSQTLNLGTQSKFGTIINKVSIRPAPLPAIEANRSAGDPPSLEMLTSQQ